MRVSLRMSCMLFLGAMLSTWSFGNGPATTAPTLEPTAEHAWRIVVTRANAVQGGKTGTVFVATVINTGKEEQILFTPGFAGPIFWPRTPFKGEPLEMFIPVRTGERSRDDHVRLRPGEGFSRVSQTLDNAQLDGFSAAGAKLIIYEKRAEGYSSKVAEVVEAPLIEIEERAN